MIDVDSEYQKIWVYNPALPFVALGKLVSFLESQFCHLPNGDNNNYFTHSLERLTEINNRLAPSDTLILLRGTQNI